MLSFIVGGCGNPIPVELIGTWLRLTSASQVETQVLSENEYIEFHKNGTVILAPSCVTGTYKFPDEEHIRLILPDETIEFRFLLEDDTLTLLDQQEMAILFTILGSFLGE